MVWKGRSLGFDLFGGVCVSAALIVLLVIFLPLHLFLAPFFFFLDDLSLLVVLKVDIILLN